MRPHRYRYALLLGLSIVSIKAPAQVSMAEVASQISTAQRHKHGQPIVVNELKPGERLAIVLPQHAENHGPVIDNLCRVGVTGHVYVITITTTESVPSALAACANISVLALQTQHVAAPELYSASDDPGSVYEYWSWRAPLETFSAPQPLDMIWIMRPYAQLLHETGVVNADKVNRAWRQALRSGGLLLLLEQRDNALPLKKAMSAAGYVYVGMQRQANRLLLFKFRKP